MKKSILTIALVVSVLALKAQKQNTEIQTVFAKGTDVRYYGAFDMAVTNIKNNVSLMLGGHGGIILNNKFLLAGGGMGLATTNKFMVQEPFQDELYISMGYGGLILGYLYEPNEIIHFTVPVMIGGGGVKVSDRPFNQVDGQPFPPLESSSIFVVEPGAQAEMNVTKFFRISLGASYRFVSGLDMEYVDTQEVQGFSGNLSFKFGKFW